MREEIRISGFGGQGVGLFGVILGRALSLYQDLNAVMTQAYGPEARGGASNANLVVARFFDAGAGMSAESLARTLKSIRP